MEFITVLRDTPLPTILVVGGIVLLLISVSSQVGGWVKVMPQRQKAAGIFGIALLVLGVSLYLVPASSTRNLEPQLPDTSPSTPPLSSHFNGKSNEGWSSTDGAVRNPGNGGSGVVGNNGYLQANPKGDGKTSYFIAPPQYHANWSGYRELRFDLKSSGGEYYISGYGLSNGDVYLASGQMSAQRSLSQRPPGDWRKFVIPLKDDGQWSFGGGATSIDTILTKVTDFQLRAEYGVGKDSSGLDNVEVVKR